MTKSFLFTFNFTTYLDKTVIIEPQSLYSDGYNYIIFRNFPR